MRFTTTTSMYMYKIAGILKAVIIAKMRCGSTATRDRNYVSFAPFRRSNAHSLDSLRVIIICSQTWSNQQVHQVQRVQIGPMYLSDCCHCALCDETAVATLLLQKQWYLDNRTLVRLAIIGRAHHPLFCNPCSDGCWHGTGSLLKPCVYPHNRPLS